MARPCTICRHPEREAIDRALVAGTPLRKIAEHYSDTSITALFRHKSDHLPPYLTKAREAQEAARADSLLEQVRSLQEKTLGILEEEVRQGGLDRDLFRVFLEAKIYASPPPQDAWS